MTLVSKLSLGQTLRWVTTFTTPIFLLAFWCARPEQAQTHAIGRTRASGLQLAQTLTVRDTIERVRFQYEGSQIQFSPDGKWFALVLERGELDRNSVRSDLVVFNTDTVIAFVHGQVAPPRPRVVATFRSTSNRPAITEVRWADHQGTLVFLAENPQQFPQVTKVNLATGKLAQLTDEPTGVSAYGYDGGGTIISVQRPSNTVPVREREAFVVRDQGLFDLLDLKNPDLGLAVYRTRVRLGNSPWADVAYPLEPTLATFQNAWVSPDGSKAVTLRKAVRIPNSWSGYAHNPSLSLAATNQSASISYWVMQWNLIDLRTGSSRVLTDTPIGTIMGSFAGGRSAFWRADSRSVILSDVLLPLEGSADDRSQRAKQPYFVEVDLQNSKVRPITALPRRNAEGAFPVAILLSQWSPSEDRLVIRMVSNNAEQPAVELVRSADGVWRERELTEPKTAKSGGPLTVEVRQAIDKAPVLIAGDTRDGREAVLLDPNPSFGERTFGKASVLEFKDATGRAWRGGLVLPVGYRKGSRYPLVIQTHGFSPSEFLIQGNGTTGYAAQALANHGIAVLQLQDQDGVINTANEPLVYMAGYEAATDRLVTDGIVDGDRVGIMGFSRTCFHVRYTLVNSKRHFAAAAVHDGVDYGYFSFVAGYDFLPGRNDSYDMAYARIWGAKPFADGLSKWVEQVPSFNLHRVQTPLMIEAINNPLFEWEWYSGLKRLNKPVEMRLIPGGSHELFKPQDQYFSQQGNVDWFTFWLQREEDPDPAKVEQYKRWRELRKLQEKNEATRTGSKQ